MSPTIHLLLVVSTILAAGVAWIIAGMTPATIVRVTAAIVGVLLYVCPVDLIDDAAATGDRTGGSDVG